MWPSVQVEPSSQEDKTSRLSILTPAALVTLPRLRVCVCIMEKKKTGKRK